MSGTTLHFHVTHFYKQNIQNLSELNALENEVNEYLETLQYPQSADVKIQTFAMDKTDQNRVDCMISVTFQEVHSQ